MSPSLSPAKPHPPARSRCRLRAWSGQALHMSPQVLSPTPHILIFLPPRLGYRRPLPRPNVRSPLSLPLHTFPHCTHQNLWRYLSSPPNNSPLARPPTVLNPLLPTPLGPQPRRTTKRNLVSFGATATSQPQSTLHHTRVFSPRKLYNCRTRLIRLRYTRHTSTPRSQTLQLRHLVCF